MRSYNTLNSLYYETQQEIDLLNRQIQVKDNIITELKIRLGQYESIYLTAGNNEPLVIGPSKSLLESLCKEAWNPQQKIKDLELKASRQAEVKASTAESLSLLQTSNQTALGLNSRISRK